MCGIGFERWNHLSVILSASSAWVVNAWLFGGLALQHEEVSESLRLGKCFEIIKIDRDCCRRGRNMTDKISNSSGKTGPAAYQ